MELLNNVKNRAIPFFECDYCHRQLEEGEFIAVIGTTPATGLSMPLGRADVILKTVGMVYCEKCYKEQNKE